MSEVQRDPPKPRKNTPAYINIQEDTNSRSMFTPTVASTSKIAKLRTKPMTLSMGLQSDILARDCLKIMNPMSTIPDGVTDDTPDACSPSRCSDWMIDEAK